MSIDVVIAEAAREANTHLVNILKSDHKISVKAQAFTGLESISIVMRHRPEVLILSTSLQDMDIKNIISRIMRQMPTAILLLYSSNDDDVLENVKRMDIGIIDYLQVVRNGQRLIINDISLTTRVHILSKLKIEKFSTQIKQGIQIVRSRQKSRILGNYEDTPVKVTNYQKETIIPENYSGKGRSSKIVIIGTSTGGPRLLSELVPKFPPNLPPVVIVQHMPVGFIAAFARRLNRLSKVRIKEAVSGESLLAGTVYLAPGGKHLQFHRISGGIPKILLTDGDPVNFVKPAVDVTLKSASSVYGKGVISVILTGMGSDGRDGSKTVKEVDGIVIALNEEDSDIYGMNRSVIEAGLADSILSKRDIVMGIIRAIEGKL